MIPASYLYRDVFADHWEAPRHPVAASPDLQRPGGPGLLSRAMAAAFGAAPAAARAAPRRTAAHA